MTTIIDVPAVTADERAARLSGKDDAVRAGFAEVRLRVEPGGPETAERYALLRQAVDAHRPVLDLFQNPSPVATTVVVR
ncbi:MAG: hypothetical protein QM604_07235 [Microbacterium sp.]